jgi:hypothetical protein
MSSPNLWWVFDSETESFGTLPTGPFMVPALIICGFLYAFKAIAKQNHTYESIAGPIAQTSRWKEKKKRYDELVATYITSNGDDLDFYELNELRKLEKYFLDPW